MSRRNGQPKTLADLPNTPVGVFDDAIGQFAEIYGSALVSQSRMFLVAICAVMLAGISVVCLYVLAQKSTAVPWLVEVDPVRGVVSKPVKIENITPNKGVVKAELAKFVEQVLTLDSALTRKWMEEANSRTSGAATTQFQQFRVAEQVVDRLAKEPSLVRSATVSSVDVTQPGVAFVFARTSESKNNQTNQRPASWRVTLKYEINPPGTEAEILRNPLGLTITSLNIVQESAR